MLALTLGKGIKNAATEITAAHHHHYFPIASESQLFATFSPTKQ